MNIHEYQAKAVLKEFGAPVASGVPIFSVAEAQQAIDSLPGPLWVVKSQIHAGGRGKGRFKEKEAGEKGGVRLGFSKEQALDHVKAMLGHTLVTNQTGPAGKQVNRLYIEDGADIEKELYLSLLVDRGSGRVAFVGSTEGGMDIEEVAHSTPDKIFTLTIDPTTGVTDADGAKVADALKLSGQARTDMIGLAQILYKVFDETDASLAEINPLIVTNDGRVVALDAKLNFDANALFRHPDRQLLADVGAFLDQQPAHLLA
jgi:succinyl-CoA synthetase beta subunit